MVRRAWLALLLAACANGEVADDDAGVDASLPDSGKSDAGASDVAAKDVIQPTEAGCPNNLTQCGNACVDEKSDPSHCGDCTTVCTAPDGGTAGCDAGACAFTCGALSQCGQACVDEKNDPNNCGGCGTSCDGGACCTSECADLASDNANCGTCGHACDGGTTCVTNVCSVVTSYDVGYPTAFTGVGSFGANYLLGEKITLSKAATLLKFGLISGTSGQHVVMALYTDKNGAPGTLVAYTTSTSVTATNMNIATSTQAALSATSYWLMAVYDTTGGPMQDTATANPIDYVAFTFGGTLPATFPTPTSYTNQHFNYYLVVQ
ncbi:MAG TPA: hypothetical protein VGH87_22090 [Polyangiaceae bacterium]|jgi:hypothetical protein